MKIIGHRGARGLAPENTLAAIEAGIAAGADEVEIDVRVTKDSVPVLWHDAKLNGLEVVAQTLQKLKQQKPDLTTLKEAITAVNRRVPCIIEVKPGVAAAPVVALLREFLGNGWQAAHFKLASFNQSTLLALHAALPEIPVVVIESWSGVRATYRARQLGAKLICMNQRYLWWGFIRSMHKNGYELFAYTVNDPAKAKRWARFGLAGIVTDHPERFTKAI